MSDPVVPIAPDVAISSVPAQRLHEKIARRVAAFEADHGAPVAFALVLMDAQGSTVPYYQTDGFDGAKSPGGGGWRGFLALAALRLAGVAMEG